MIEHFTDHAANERTYLAWVRTAISVMAFGFLIEKFDLLLAARDAAVADAATGRFGVAEATGLVLFLSGTLIVIAATVRFFVHKTNIDSAEPHRYREAISAIGLSLLVIALAAFVLFYLLYQLD